MEFSGIGLFADKWVGEKTLELLATEYPDHIKFLVVTGKNSAVYMAAVRLGIPKGRIFFPEELNRLDTIEKLTGLDVSYLVLAWWPSIVKEPVTSIPRIGVLNFHPSLLPHNRGKHYNFWTIVEETPFGVTIHFADESVDGGDILFQRSINKGWEDTGKSLYEKAQEAMIGLFREKYPDIILQNYTRKKQDLSEGSFHMAEELDKASEIVLEKKYRARDLLNLLRARTFPPHPAAWFEDQGERFEVRVEITKVKR